MSDTSYIGEEDISPKQRIGLSSFAYNVISSDLEDFSFKESDKNLSNFLNRILLNFSSNADSSIFSKTATLLEAMRNGGCAFKEKDEEKLRAYFEKRYSEDATRRLAKDSSEKFIISLNKDCVSLLQDNDFTPNLGEEVYCSLGRYFKALYEEYAEKDRSERERIYFKDLVDSFYAIKAKNQRLKIITRTKVAKNGESSHSILYLSPYKIVPGLEGDKNYVVGWGKLFYSPLGKEKETSITAATPSLEKAISLRLNNILSIESSSLGSGRIIEDNVKALDSLIARYGGDFPSTTLSSTTGAPLEIHFRVRFSKEGWDAFHHISHRKPRAFTKTEDPLVYDFTCSRFQAETYFFQFGSRIEILAPDWLREEFKKRYEDALKVYEPSLQSKDQNDNK